ncbi:C4-dicarboxylate TRAP transporter substrate-binding protein [Salibacterium aidingense]|uniref:C4-dicarboxylate TRAP transporter substrate-binding protein n=1 Tax=Salibacterium aidingense TaxID=384933 RepID=UPI0004145BE1|nr:C4-dicarboxylate TRAP transporter substrate-binding protein [Salibacterium aidingense]
MSKKNWFIMYISTIMIGFLAACGGSTEDETSATEDEVYEIDFAYGNQPGEPTDQVAKKWKELAEEESNGRIKLNTYPSSQLGDEADVIEQAQSGSNVIVLTGYDFLMDYVPDMGILTAPYLVDDFDELLYLTTTDWFQGLESDLEDEGLGIISTDNIYGSRNLMTKEEVLTPGDLQGKRIRTPDNDMAINSFEALGASPTPLALDELYPSLQQGVVDGAENPLVVLEGTKTHEVTDYLALTEHQKFITPWVAGTSFLETLPEDIRTILEDTADEAAANSEELVKESNEEVLETFEEEGITIHEVDQEPFKEKAMDMYEEMDQWSPELYEKVQELLNER